eukprot:TRINITY_DN5844_c0_g1_i6.p1 TRINITY_DN5844_c0_g1~~TRINITY_DN5844_c0_g1_i6.p1  ORF type:complete len:364 (-),score=62.85 TRINITY_DN5844_c0_g1_i6:97-1188(-)
MTSHQPFHHPTATATGTLVKTTLPIHSLPHFTSKLPFYQVFSSSPLLDAQRRDFTVNSLFYRIETQEIEDLTGLGLCDLRSRVIRTPVNPEKTLAQDPLRALRAIRFATLINPHIHEFSPENWTIFDSGLLTAIKSSKVHMSLNNMVSRERIFVELVKILQLPNATLALDLFHTFGFYPIFFRQDPPLDHEFSKKLTNMVKLLFHFHQKVVEKFEEFLNNSFQVDEKILLLLLSSVYVHVLQTQIGKPSMSGGAKKQKTLLDLINLKDLKDFWIMELKFPRAITRSTLSGVSRVSEASLFLEECFGGAVGGCGGRSSGGGLGGMTRAELLDKFVKSASVRLWIHKTQTTDWPVSSPLLHHRLL